MKRLVILLNLVFLLIASNSYSDDFTRKTTWVTSDLITASKLNADPDETARVLGTSSNGLISNGNIKSTAAIIESKITFDATSGHDHDGISSNSLGNSTVASAQITDGTIVNADVNASADIVSSKIAFSVSGWDIDGTTVTSSATELNLLTGVTGTVVTESTSLGGLLSGTLPNPGTGTYFKAAQYFEPDSSCIVAFDNGSLALDLSTLHNVISLTSLAEADLVDGKVSAKCYDYDGTNDWVTIATNALQAGMSALTVEAVVYRDTAGNTDAIVATDNDLYISLTMDDTHFHFVAITSGGTETASIAHGLSGNGINQWVHVVAAWDSSTAADIIVNGVDTGNGDGSGTGTVNDSANGINIGSWGDETLPFHGKIDGVRVLRRRMAVAEALARYNAFN